MMKRIAAAACGAALVIGGLVASAPPALAANQDKHIDLYEMAYYYSPNLKNAFSDFSIDIPSLSGYTFIGGSGKPGFGQAVRNNAASVDNWDPDYRVRVWYSPNYQGANETVAKFGWKNLAGLRNDNASHKFIS